MLTVAEPLLHSSPPSVDTQHNQRGQTSLEHCPSLGWEVTDVRHRLMPFCRRRCTSCVAAAGQTTPYSAPYQHSLLCWGGAAAVTGGFSPAQTEHKTWVLSLGSHAVTNFFYYYYLEQNFYPSFSQEFLCPSLLAI